jgi:hypothetical protein
MSRLSESLITIPLIEAKDYGSAGVDADGVNLGLVHAFTAVFVFGTLTGNSILKVYAGATAAKTTAVAFAYRLGAADYKVALADTLGDPIAVASTGLTLTATTFDHRMVVVEIDPDTMPSGKPWVTFEIDATATAMTVGAVGVARPRYASHVHNSVI